MPELRPELTGYEMVVVSANNTAVENVSEEIPARKAIHSRWRGEANYFADIATATLHSIEATTDDTSPLAEAWGLVAARLGNKRNRNAFYSAFWFDPKEPRTDQVAPIKAPRMQTRLKQWRDGHVPHRTWDEALADFARAERRVDALLAELRQAQRRRDRLLPLAVEDVERFARDAAEFSSQVRGTVELHEAAVSEARRAEDDHVAAAQARERHVSIKPGVLETIFSLGRANREWRAGLKPWDERSKDAERTWRQATGHSREWADRLGALRRDLTTAEAGRTRASLEVATLRRQMAADEIQVGPGYPSESWTGRLRELRAPWLDPELDAARSDLFLAALRLHEDFLANAAAEMTDGLRAALEVVVGSCPHRLESEKRRAAWQLFFLVVPLVSTTFASFGRMFGDTGPESIGWLLIDEAGQASPQHAVGAIWRSRRVVAVGDPLQLQPVVTIPQKVQRDMAAAFGVSDVWIPPRASVQTLADRGSRLGTTLDLGDESVWVSAPLTVHRRCDEPMFSLCNSIAYNGIMVNGVERSLDDPDRPDLFDSPSGGALIAASHWADQPNPRAGSHLQEAEIERLERGLGYLTAHGVPMSDVIAISPFRDVADRLAPLSWRYPDLRAGTIHTAQGREAAVVFLVLGGDPKSPGAKAWAASTVNLVNVAASRAKRRLYVIGDHASWSRHNYFSQLAVSLSPSRRATAGREAQSGEPRK